MRLVRSLEKASGAGETRQKPSSVAFAIHGFATFGLLSIMLRVH